MCPRHSSAWVLHSSALVHHSLAWVHHNCLSLVLLGIHSCRQLELGGIRNCPPRGQLGGIRSYQSREQLGGSRSCQLRERRSREQLSEPRLPEQLGSRCKTMHFWATTMGLWEVTQNWHAHIKCFLVCLLQTITIVHFSSFTFDMDP